jgi:hypothetical protein
MTIRGPYAKVPFFVLLTIVGTLWYPPQSRGDSSCPALREPVNKSAVPLAMITEAPIPGPRKARQPATPDQLKCTDDLLNAGKRAIEKKRLVEGVTRYLAAVKVAPAQAELVFQELASVLDQKAYVGPALAAYYKAWKVFEANYNQPDAKLDSVAVLALADIRDSIVRLGGNVPTPTSDVGRTVIANSTRHLREQYFNTDPLLGTQNPDSTQPAQPAQPPPGTQPAQPTTR